MQFIHNVITVFYKKLKEESGGPGELNNMFPVYVAVHANAASVVFCFCRRAPDARPYSRRGWREKIE